MLALLGWPARRGRGWLTPVLAIPTVMGTLVLAGFASFVAAPAWLTVLMLAAAVVVPVAAIVAFGAARAARAAVVLACGAAAVVAAMQPMIGWSAGVPDRHQAAAIQAVVIGAVGFVLTVVAGQLTRRLGTPRGAGPPGRGVPSGQTWPAKAVGGED